MLVDLPDDVLLHVLYFLRLPSIIALRQTCQRIHNLTHDRTTWTRLLSVQRSILPLSANLRSRSSSYVFSLTLKDLEKIVLSNYQIARSWLLPRRTTLPFPRLGESLLSLQLFLDRWLLVIYSDGLVNVWDLQGDSPVKCVTLALGYRGWSSSASAIDGRGENIFLAVTRAGGPVPTITVLYNVPLPTPSGKTFPPTVLHTLHNLYALSCRAIIPSVQTLLMAHGSRILITRWLADSHSSTTVFLGPTETAWDGAIEIQYCDPYLLCVRAHSIELYPIPPPLGTTTNGPSLPILKYIIRHSSLREASVSSPVYSSSVSHEQNTETTTITVSVLAFDIFQGVSCYDLTVHIPPPDTVPPYLFVRLAGVYATAGGNDQQIRTYVSSLSLGPQAKRGLWVERSRENTARSVVVFSHPTLRDVEDDERPDSDETVALDGRVVHTSGSYDLRDDLVLCALGEVSGKIVLGVRSGDVMMLHG